MKRVLVAGIGNIFFGDDAFGCEVARELGQRPLPEGGSACVRRYTGLLQQRLAQRVERLRRQALT